MAMQQSGAEPPEPDCGGEGDKADDAASVEPVVAYYPDPNEIDSSSPTIPVRNRLSRTPHKKARDADIPPLQPTASRPRATVERVQRSSKAVPPGGTPGPNTSGGGSPTAMGSRSKPPPKSDADD